MPDRAGGTHPSAFDVGKVHITRTNRRGVRLDGNLDLYNLFNGSSILATNGRYGSAWLTPTQVLGGRLFKIAEAISATPMERNSPSV